MCVCVCVCVCCGLHINVAQAERLDGWLGFVQVAGVQVCRCAALSVFNDLHDWHSQSDEDHMLTGFTLVQQVHAGTHIACGSLCWSGWSGRLAWLVR